MDYASATQITSSAAFVLSASKQLPLGIEAVAFQILRAGG
jgi:hypothetical protein